LEFKPVIHHASMSFLRHHETLAAEIASAQTLSSQLSLNKIILFAWLAGFFLFTINYLHTLMTLKKLQRDAFCRYHLNNVHILFSSRTTIPFCWSFFQNHFIIIPNALLEKREEMQLAIRHELQHIRQGDTHWLQIMIVIKLIFFWNPFLMMWMKWLNELQEFACDEAVIHEEKRRPHNMPSVLSTQLVTRSTPLFSNKVS
jgi:beta-lactamase regulating signal transducer with metallopeptidase domain